LLADRRYVIFRSMFHMRRALRFFM
jgi:hypothetical protein